MIRKRLAIKSRLGIRSLNWPASRWFLFGRPNTGGRDRLRYSPCQRMAAASPMEASSSRWNEQHGWRVAVLEDDRQLRDDILVPGLRQFGFQAVGLGRAAELYRCMPSTHTNASTPTA